METVPPGGTATLGEVSNDAPERDLHWLPERQREWAERHRPVLAQIFSALERDGDWPDPVELERRLRAQGIKLGLVAAVNAMPPSLGHRIHHPSQVELTLFGLACVPEAGWLIDAYVATLHLGLERFDDPAAPRMLGRAHVQERLGLDDPSMTLLSIVLLSPGNIFLAGGNASRDGWELDIDERVVQYEAIQTADELLAELAEQRLVHPVMSMDPRDGHAPASEPHAAQASTPSASAPAPAPAPHSVGTALALAVSAGANLLAVVLAPLPFAVGVIAATVTAGVLHRRIVRPDPSLAAVGAVIVVGIAAALFALVIRGAVSDGHPTSDRASALSRLEVGQQLQAMLHKDAQQGRRAVFRAVATLHGPGTPPSYVVVLRDDRLKEHPAGDVPTDERGRFITPRSDELRIYDQVGGTLKLAFRILPQGLGQIRQAPEGDSPAFRFRAMPPVDIDGDGRPELTGTFERVTLASGPYPVPVLVSWDDGAQRYRIASVVRDAPRLTAPTSELRAALTGYTKPTLVEDRYTKSVLKGYATDAYKIVTSRPNAVVVGAYRDQTATSVLRERYRIEAWSLDLESGTLETLRCFDRPAAFTAEPHGPLPQQLDRWFRARQPPGCEV